MLSQLYRQVLGALWTAGYRPSMKERVALQCMPGISKIAYTQPENDELARDILIRMGYHPTDEGSGLRLLPMLAERTGPKPTDSTPLAGHLVETNGLWSVPEVRLSGYYEDPTFTSRIGNRVAAWNANVERLNFSLSCGGPASILSVDTDKLEPTGRTAWLNQWDFAMLPAGNTAVYWMIEAPIWSAKEIKFLDFPREQKAA